MAALFVLFGLLLNVATATGAQLDRDPRAARLGNSEVVRTASSARLAGREDDGSDQGDALATLPPAPNIVSLAATSYPSGASRIAAAAARPLDPHFRYRARAPPAA